MRNALISIALLSAVAAGPIAAQDTTVDLRVGKLEKEMKAVQRKVFPGGVPVQPEIGPLDTGDAGAAPASTPLTDLSSRVDALESQLKMLTGQVETDGNRLKKLEDAVKAYQTATDGRLKALEPAVPATVVTVPDAAAPAPKPVNMTPAATTAAPAVVTPKPAATKPKVDAPAPAKAAPAPAKGDPKRKALVDAVEIPATGDTAEDAYTYGFRLWTAKLYPEAQVKLKEFGAKYPKHKRASFAQNLLGRAYLDEGKPALASVAFYDNYTKNPKGDRASESLYYLGVALTRLKKLPDACKVFDEFKDVYGASASTDLKARVAKARTDASCAA